jgi:excinuclease UvrABC ATPase subunit
VVGRSGSGKSSLVFAGLLPPLRKQNATQAAKKQGRDQCREPA